VLATMWCPLAIVSVIATVNHYLSDVAAGLLVTGLVFGSRSSANTRSGRASRFDGRAAWPRCPRGADRPGTKAARDERAASGDRAGRRRCPVSEAAV